MHSLKKYNDLFMIKNNLTRIWVRRLVNYTFIIGIVLGLGVLTYELRPPEFVYTNDDFNWQSHPSQYNASKWNVYLDAHAHTTGSDGVLTPEQSLLWNIAQGFNAVIVTDHNTWANGEEMRQIARTKYNDSIKVLIGMEWGTLIHMNLIIPPNVTEYQQIKGKTSTPTNEEIQNVIKVVHDLGGIVVVNHVFNSPDEVSNYPTRQQLFDWGVDYFEWYNEKYYDNASATFSQTHGMGEISGTDTHGPDTVYIWNAMSVSTVSESSVFDGIKNRQITILYDASGVPSNATPSTNPAYIPLKPLIALGNMVESYYVWYMNFDWIGIIVLLGYLYGAFFLYYLMGSFKDKFWNKVKAHKELN